MSEPTTPTERVAAAQAEIDAASAALAAQQEQAERGTHSLSKLRVGLREAGFAETQIATVVEDVAKHGPKSGLRLCKFIPAGSEQGHQFESSTAPKEVCVVLGPDDPLPNDGRNVTDLKTAGARYGEAWESIGKALEDEALEDEVSHALSRALDNPAAFGALGDDAADLISERAEPAIERLATETGVRLSPDFQKAIREAIAAKDPRALADLTLVVTRTPHPDGGDVLVGSVACFGQDPVPTGPGVMVTSARRWLARVCELGANVERYGPGGGGLYLDEDGRSTLGHHEFGAFRHSVEA